MELTFATNLLATVASNKQQEVDALNLAVKMLQDKFGPELTRMNNAEAQVARLNEANIEKAQIIIVKEDELETEKAKTETLTVEKTNLEDVIASLEVEKDTLLEENISLKLENEALKNPVVEIVEEPITEEPI